MLSSQLELWSVLKNKDVAIVAFLLIISKKTNLFLANTLLYW